ncbi:MAG TPA: hypothetical protein VNY30_19690, partial [Bryobacteraceae bacterium]|nr:hypothetical protein [Bryobacteraceae bacterium]
EEISARQVHKSIPSVYCISVSTARRSVLNSSRITTYDRIQPDGLGREYLVVDPAKHDAR